MPETSLLEADPAPFRAFDRRCFDFGHRLGDDPRFAPSRLLALAKTMSRTPGRVYYDAGDVRIEQRWDQVAVCDVPVEGLLERIESAGAWIVLRDVDREPEYAPILDGCIAEIEALAGIDVGKLAKIRKAIIFINSPHRVSSYHIDRECNCLLQICGEKTVHVFDREDRDVLPEDEIERFWTVDNNAAVYKPQFESRANTFALVPGRGVHIPVNAPHWVQNGDQVSVSISINFHYHDRLLADVYRANYWMRRLGLRPTPPRRSALRDGIKGSLYGSARTLRGLVRGRSAGEHVDG
ncbi:MAG: transcriptional regulator [Vulcanimicrobiaceae bacterium]